MTNRNSVIKARRLRSRAGLSSIRSPFETRILAHIEARQRELEAIAYRGRKVA